MIYTAETTLRKIHNGKDGEKIYIKYATDPSGIMSDKPVDGFDYLGICQSSDPFPPNDINAYTWMKYKGDPGANGQNGRPGNDGKDGVSSYIHIKFSNDGGESFTSNDGEDPGDWIGIYTDADPVDSMVPEKYQWTKTAGQKGTDSTSIILTNETHTFQGGDDEVLPASATSQVIAHTGTLQVPVTIGTPTLPSGMTFVVNDNNTVNAGFTVSIDGTLQQRSGSISIPITISGMEFTKDFTWTVAMRGEKGDEGATCNVSGEQVFKYLSDATAPTQDSLTLTAEYNNTTHKEWQYKNGDGVWTSYSPSKSETTISITPTDPCWNNGNTAVLRAIDITGNVYDAISLIKVRDGNTGEAAIIGYLSNDSHRIPTDGEGNNGDYYGASTTMSIFQGTTDISDTFTYTASASEGIKGTLSGRTYTVTEMTVDTGYIDITAKRTGYPDVVKRFNLSLLKSATAYWLVTNANVIFKDDIGLDPTAITMNGKCKSGDSSIMDYAARFEVYHDDDLVYSSTVDESSYTYTVPTDTTSIRIVMKEAGGTGVVLDEQNIPVVTDGRPGYDGYTVYLTNQNESFPCDADGNIASQIATSTTVIAYKGIEEVLPVIGTLPTVPGLQLSTITNDSGKSMIMIVALEGTELAQSGSFEIPMTIDEKPFTAVFSWTKLMDATGLKAEVETIKETMFNVDKDKQLIEAIVRETKITTSEDSKTISEQFTQFSQSLNEISTTVGSIETDFDGQITSLQTQITQTADKLNLIATGDSSSSITLTPNFISLVSGAINFDGVLSFYNSVATGTDKTEINGSKITTGLVKSANYSAPTDDTLPYSVSGTAFDLSTGNIYSENFAIINDDGELKAYFKGDGEFTGTIHATGGSFDGDITALGTITGGTFVGGILRSPNYSYSSGNFSTNGMEINTDTGTIRTKNTFLSADGVLYVNGIQATNGNFSGTITGTNISGGSISGTTITGNSIISGGTITGATISGNTITGGSINIGSGRFQVNTSGNVTCQSIDINGGTIDIGSNFHVSSDGSVTANNGSFTGDIDANSLRVKDKIIIYGATNETSVTLGDYSFFESVEGFDGSYTSDYTTRIGVIDYNCTIEFGVHKQASGSGMTAIGTTIDFNAVECDFNNSDLINIRRIVDAGTIYADEFYEGDQQLQYKYAAASHTHSTYARPTTLYRGSTAYVETYSSGGNYYLIPSSTSVNTYLGVNSNGMRFRGVSAAVGTFSERVTINGAEVSTSDKYDKTNINNISEAYENMFLDIEPVTYMRKNLSSSDDHDRIHCGIIAQQLQEAAEKNGLSTETFAGICIENLEEPLPDGRTTRYGIAYNELHGLEIHMIQKLYKKVSVLQEKVESLEKQLSAYAS